MIIKQRKPKDKRYKIDHDRTVRVYRNLHKKCYSIQQDGLVKAHATELYLFDSVFQVNKKGRERVLVEKKKNVHAFVVESFVEYDNLSSQSRFSEFDFK